ncbi:CPBP family intramembrane metalloprotease [Maribacter sp. PR1]|uniref:CPBP family intramembrane glutamic endopeptidase n=1 Tax=Maribacter cobaltidurans TaxID=1178778 RepID=A0ABU7IVV1_9FLAO|nr:MULTISPECIES: CPBP family intramembrane glutamic endopeptidase [Maribacter]MDC6389730.1 CPBP family intramembrane metalloprotease [Maribacter sp. PR1]MEE1977120.1 CPBP family intramembrane glutamic endopeptidase [Maribacter cobaltidurans]
MYIEQAYKGDNASWKVILTTLISTGVFIVNFIFFLLISPEDLEKTYELMKQLPPIVNLVSNLAPFIFLLLVLILLVIFLHKRSFVSLTTARKKIDFSRLLFSASFTILLTVLFFAIGYGIDPEGVEWNFKPYKFLILVFASLILFPFQIGFEEYLFRGYLMQQIGVLVKNKWFPLLLTSVMFGLMHSANPEVAEMGYITMVLYIGFGLLMGIMTLMDDGIELALGFHLGNNLMAALLVTSDWSAIQADSLFKNTAESASGDIVQEMLLSVFVTFPLILFVLSKKYKWTNWKERLTGKVLSKEEFLAKENQ